MTKPFWDAATNPHQYDLGEVDWKKEGSRESHSRHFWHEHLAENLDVAGKRVLDVGSGTGSLFPFLKEAGAVFIEGVEPSKRNLETSNRLYPEVHVYHDTIENASIDSPFDVIVCVMAFEHIADISLAFSKVASLLSIGGTFDLVVADKSYHLSPRFGYKIAVEDEGDGVVVVKTTRPYGTLYDVLRPLEMYVREAEKSGLILEKRVGLKPTPTLIEEAPTYADFADVAIGHLLVFRKN